MATQIQLRRDTAANWFSVNPIPAQGEECYELDTGRRKVGDGLSAYNSLPYDNGGNPNIAIADANGNTLTSGTAVFSNSNNVSFGLNGSVMTASFLQTLGLYGLGNTTQSSSGTVDPRSVSFVGAGIVSVGVTNGSVVISATGGGGGNGSIVFSAGILSSSLSAVTFNNANGVSFGLLAGVITASVGAGVGPGSISAGTTSVGLGQAVFSNSNGVSFGLNGSTITGSVAAQTNQTLGFYASSNTTQSSSGTLDARSISMVGAGLVSVGYTNGSLVVSATGSHGISAGTQSVNSGTVVFANSNGISFGMSGSSQITATYTVPSIVGLISAINVSAGTTSNNLSALTFSNANGVTFGIAGSVITASVPAVAGAQTGISGIQVSNTTYSSGTVSFVNANNISFGSSGANGISASYSQSAQSVGIYVPSQSTGQSSSSTGDARSLSIIGQGIISAGWSNSSFVLSATTAAQTNQTVGFYASSNTTGQSSSSTKDARSITIVGAGNVSVGWSNSSFVISGVGGGAAVNVAAGSQTATSGTVLFSNSNGISFGMSNSSVITASYSVPSVAGLLSAIGVSAGGVLTNISAISFNNSNGVSFGLNGLTLTASIANQTNQTVGLYAGSNTTQGTSGTVDARSLSIIGAGAVSVGVSNNSYVISAAAGAQSNQTVGIYAASWTTGAASSSTADARTLNIGGAGCISVGWSNNTFFISGPATTSGVFLSAGMSNGGNTAGTSGIVSNQMVFYGGANITLSQSVNAGSATLSIIGGAGGGGGGGGIGAGVSTAGNTAGSTGIVTTGNVVFVGQGAMTLSQSTGAAGSAATISMIVPATSSLVGTNGISVSVTGSTISISNLGVNISAGTTSGNMQSFTFSNANGVSFGLNGSVITASAAGGGGGGGGGTISAGTTNIALGQAIFSNSNGVSFGINGSTVTASILAQSNQTVGFYALGNTTQNSSTTLDARSLSFNALGAMTMGYTNGSIQVSAPATSSLVGANGITVSTAGSTISVMQAPTYASFYDPYANAVSNVVAGNLNGNLQLDHMNGLPYALSVSQFDWLFSMSVSQTNSSAALKLSISAGIYTLNGSTLSLLTSGSQSYSATNSSTNGAAAINGNKALSLPMNFSLSGAGDYWIGMILSSSTVNTGIFTLQQYVNTAVLSGAPLFGVVQSSSNQAIPGRGVYSVTTGGMPASIAISQIYGTNLTAPIYRAVNLTA